MPRSDFTFQIDNIISAISALNSSLDKISPKFGKLSLDAASSLRAINEYLDVRSISQSANEMQRVLNILMEIKSSPSFQSLNRDAKAYDMQLRIILDKIAAMRDNLQMLSVLQKNATSVGLGHVYPFTEQTLRKYYPPALENATKPYSTFGVYNRTPQSLGLGATFGSFLGPLETAIHELGHHVSRLAEQKGAKLYDITKSVIPEAGNIEDLSGVLENKFLSAGLSKDAAKRAAEVQASRMMLNVEEAFADEFTNLALTGKTAFPNFQQVIDRVSSFLSKDIVKNINQLTKELISTYEQAIMDDIYAGLPAQDIDKRGAPLLATVGTAPPTGGRAGKPLLGMDLESGAPTPIGELGEDADEANTRVVELRKTIEGLQAELLKITPSFEDIMGGNVSKEQADNVSKISQKLREALVELRELKNYKLDLLPSESGAPTSVEELGNQADETKRRIEALRAELDRLIQESLRGTKTPTPEGLTKLQEKLLGGEELSERQRVGGGAYLSQSKEKRQEIVNLANTIREEIKNLNDIQRAIEEVGKQPVSAVGAGAEKLSEVDKALVQSWKDHKRSQRDEIIGKGMAEFAFTDEQKLAAGQTLKPILDLYDRLGLTLESLSTKYRILSDGTVEFSFALKDNTGAVQKSNAYLTQQNEILTKTQYAQTRIPTVSGVLKEAFPGLKEEQIAGIAQNTKEVTDVYERLGTTLTTVGAKYNVADDGVIAFTISMQDSAGTILKTNAYLTKEGTILDEVAYKSKLAAEATQKLTYTREGLIKSLTPQRAERALALAEKYGFTEKELVKVGTQAPAGVSILKFQGKDAQGVFQELEVTVDRFGNALTRTNRRLLSFFDAMVKNTQELLKWSLGVGLVYGSYYRFQRLLETAIENETKLADITVTLGDVHIKLRDIFNDAATVAKATGETINEVLETYVMAYRAVGGVEDPIKRTAAANKLLYDSVVLNKLSGLEAAAAIDVLSGSLRQLQKPGEDVATAFERGTYLLDSWVAVSRKANVDLATLATAFSITSESAENAGASIEEINAVIAVLSEKIGGLGGRETGNAVRAIIGGIYQQNAAEVLGRYGVAVTDASGKMRDFLDVARDVYELQAQGIIDEDQLNKIAYAWGGGVRRGQQVVAFLSDYQRILEIVKVQEDAYGSAQDALARKMATTQTSIKQMNNAFQGLAQTLGDEGGLLETANGLISAFTKLVELISNISQSIGRITIPVALLGIMKLFLRGTPGQERVASWGTGLGMMTGNALASMLGGLPYFGQQVGTTAPQQIPTRLGGMREVPGQAITRAQQIGLGVQPFVQKYGLGILAGSYPAISRAAGAETAADWGKAGLTLGGAIVGTLLAGGNPIGGVIGSSFVEAAITGFEKSKGELEDIFVSPYKGAVEEEKEEKEKKTTYELKVETANLELAKLGEGDLYDQIAAALTTYIGRAAGKPIREGGVTVPMWRAEIARETVQDYQRGIKVGMPPKELYDQAIKALAAIEEAERYKIEEVPMEYTQMGRMQAGIAGTEGIYREFLNEIADEQRDVLRDLSVSREIKPREYKERLEYTFALPTSVSMAYTALYKDQENFNKATREGEQALNDLSEALLAATVEDREYVNQIATSIFDINKGMEELEGKATDAFVVLNGQAYTYAQLVELDKDKTQELADMLKAIGKEAEITLAQKQKMPSIIGFEDYDPNQMQTIVNKAKELERERYRALEDEGILAKGTYDTLKEEADPIAAYLGERFAYFFIKELIDSGLLKQAEEQLLEEGKLPKQNIGYQFMEDVTQAQFQAILPQYEAIKRSIELAGGQVQEDPLLTFFKDSTSPVYMNKDWKIVQYLLQKILETEEKQLDGLYNLPSEGTFYVPSQALQMAYNAGVNAASGGGVATGGGNVVSPGTEEVKKVIQPSPIMQEIINYRKKFGEDFDLPIREQPVERPDYGVPTNLRGYFEEVIPESLKGIFEQPAAPQGSRLENLLQDLLNFFRVTIPNMFGGTSPTEVPENLKGILSNAAGGNQTPTTNLKLDMSSSIQLLVDGRVLATIVKQYLWEDLIRFDSTAGTSTRTVIV